MSLESKVTGALKDVFTKHLYLFPNKNPGDSYSLLEMAHDLGAKRTELITFGVERDKFFPTKPRGQRHCLRYATLRQPAIEMALANAFNIPLRLPVTNDDNLRALHCV